MTAAFSGIFAIVVVASAVVFWLAFRTTELSELDRSMSAQAQTLRGLIHDRPDAGFVGVLPDETAEGTAVEAILVDGSGKALDRTSHAPTQASVRALGESVLRSNTPIVETTRIDGHTKRVLAERTDLVGGGVAALILTRPTGAVQQALSLVGLLLAVAAVVTISAASALGYWLAGRALRPVGVITDIAHDLSEGDLRRRIDLDLPRDELGKLADTLNEMLARLEAAFASLRQFTSDAAHELRAPLALIRTEVEVTLSSQRTPVEYEAALNTVLTETDRLSRLADQLLLLATADAGALSPRRDVIDFKDLLEETLDRWRHVAAQRTVRLRSELPSSGRLLGDADLLRRLLDNLIDNAVRHTPPGGNVTVAAKLTDHIWYVSVVDSGQGVPLHVHDRLFERFSRGDSGRGRDTGGAGLGLALCAAIAAAHGGTIHLDPSSGDGARFVVALPAERPVHTRSE